ncbi:MAG: GNAT family N-acetyltransferase [Bacteroidota bacterium]
MEYILKTQRLGLRNWEMADLEAAVEMNSDPEVMRFFPKTHDRKASIGMIEKFQKHFDARGFTYFAVDELEGEKALGFVGLFYQEYEAPFTPCVDIGWRLRKQFWGKGYAPEAAQACLGFAFSTLDLQVVVATTPSINLPSRRVMEKIGMVYQGEYLHPKVPNPHSLQPSVWYKIEKERQ